MSAFALNVSESQKLWNLAEALRGTFIKLISHNP